MGAVSVQSVCITRRGLTSARGGRIIGVLREHAYFGTLALQAHNSYNSGLPISGVPRVSLSKNHKAAEVGRSI